VFLTKTSTTDRYTSHAIKEAAKAQAASAAVIAKAQAASAAAALKAQAASAAAAAKAQAASTAAAAKAQAGRSAATANAWQVTAVAAEKAASAAKSAGASVNSGVRQGIYTARSWAAPKLEDAAEYTTRTAAPKVSAALRSTARQVKPPKSRRMPSALTWSLLAAAILAGAGAVAALLRYRYQEAITADSEQAEDNAETEQLFGGKPPAGEQPGTSPADGASTAESGTTDSSVNGRASSTKW